MSFKELACTFSTDLLELYYDSCGSTKIELIRAYNNFHMHNNYPCVRNCEESWLQVFSC